MKGQNLIEVMNVLKEQLLKWFLELLGNIYPDLVKVFYTNLHVVGDNVCSHMKGIDMKTTLKVWSTVTGMKYIGLRINKGNIGVVLRIQQDVVL